MKSLSLTVLTFCYSLHGFAATPFSYSGQVIGEVFASREVSMNVFGAVKSIEHLQYDQFSKTHSIHFVTQTCEFTGFVQNVGDEMVPVWKTTTTDLTGCK